VTARPRSTPAPSGAPTSRCATVSPATARCTVPSCTTP
jgi:hypothetical protein